MSNKANWTYLLRCSDDTLYAGWTVDLEKRVESHNQGKGAKYTRSRRPVTIAWAKQYETKSQAMQQECALKKMSKLAKETLVATEPYVENK